jgi:RHS repeat-associated protein
VAKVAIAHKLAVRLYWMLRSGEDYSKVMERGSRAGQSVTFDNASRLTSIVQGASNVSFAYDSDGRRTSLTLPNGVVATYSYDAASQLTGIVYQGGALSPQNLAYSYDLAGRRVGVSGTLASTQLPAAVASAVYNANNQLTQWGSTAMTYDLNGNTLNDGTNSYSWDARNRMVSADGTGASFTYDPLGRRVSKTVMSTITNFLYDGANAVQEFGANPTANLLTGGVDERFTRTSATETDNYLTDALGSTVALTGSTGATQVRYSYDPYGGMSIAGSTNNSYAYTGREFDGLAFNGTAIDYYRARYYNPNTGRFLSEDPIGFDGSGPNLYAYAPNNGPTQPTQPTTPPKDWCQFYKTSINIDTDLMYLSGGGATWARISGKAVFADVLAPELAVVSLWAFTDRAISRYGGNWEHGCHN